VLPPLEERAFSNDDLRLSERTLIEEVEITAREIEAIVDVYEENLAAIVQAANASGARVILMNVASNWKWRGMDDLPDDWLAEWSEGAEGAEAWSNAALGLDVALAAADPKRRAELLHRRALVAEEQGDLEGARVAYRGSMNEDPHLRRALDRMNERVVRVAAEAQGVIFVDTVEVLASEAENGIVGFGEFYDYVHFTPKGTLRVAAALYRVFVEAGWIDQEVDFDPQAFVAAELERLESEADGVAVDFFVGFGFDRGRLHDRDLWKYEKLGLSLDHRIEADPRDARALAYRGNTHYFEPRGAANAEADYRAALAIEPADGAVRRNLERLLSEGRR
jgi:hypothetical protein